ncbi:molybdopterin synthase catalytic subunit [Leeuwenhoekiella aestuarii]|uniref:Molybdopterin synthase catalytic subunit n=1 Tax=Leeuwenhoekiella aestuarii TaxID=2249426 RepID=A0A4V1KNT4_9FLAO|nr:molybdenum cofactor biosynthesis protein MoaE [Leeuwenhoekiella aestuarii]RXG11959.1 molybdopterin synthase catalytic subunit [Leeuwenhoekiella aestuarii]RXG13517.1 molybdopterin synthase catalytic subunit [Leeuwenhoekiella aestuarii]
MKKVFISGPISSDFIGESIAKHQTKTSIGAHNIFLGQVRADEVEGKKVAAIEYTCYEELANTKLHEIREEAFEKFDLICMHIYHSLGTIKTGEVCFFVFVSAKRRNEVYAATEWLVNQVKDRTPIYGKEIFEDATHQWKVNS